MGHGHRCVALVVQHVVDVSFMRFMIDYLVYVIRMVVDDGAAMCACFDW